MSVESVRRDEFPPAGDAQRPRLEEVALVCIGRLLFSDPTVEPLGAEQTWLFHRYTALRGLGEPRELLARCLRAPVPVDAPLARLAADLGLRGAELLSLSLALMVEEQALAGRLLAHLQEPVGGSRPSLGLLASAFALLEDESWLPGDLLGGVAVANGVLQIPDTQAPLPERVVRVPLGLALALRGRPPNWPGTRRLDPAQAVRLPPSVREQAARHAEALAGEEAPLLAIRTASHAEACSAAAEVARCLDAEPLFIDADASALDGLGAACRMTGLLPVFDLHGAGSDARQPPPLRGWRGPRLALLGSEGQMVPGSAGMTHWILQPPSRDERQQLWQAHLGDPVLAARLAAEHMHGAGRIAELAGQARREARLRRCERPAMEDVRRAAGDAETARLGRLAQPLSAEIPDQALVLPQGVDEDLQQLLARCRHREGLDCGLGITIRARYQAGVRGLLVGPSGTGKTLAAGWLASRLGLPLYRVDLASVVSKYIGETEKNLAELLARAEHSEIVLLFDEADSLFGKRTDIKDSNDRFANSQTNYLLQRIEFYRGIILLTSNSRDRFDSAFTRRLDAIIDFPLPGPQQRRALWQVHLGEAHGLSARQINQLAAACDLAGGHIRNAVLAAAVSAAEAGRPLGLDDVLRGLGGEYRKLGRQFPAELRRAGGEES